MTQDSAALEQLRREIDRIDDQMHDLLMRRAAMVERIVAAKGDKRVTLRPGREAQIIRRLVGRHSGAFPRLALVRIWREIIGTLTGLQSPLTVAVHAVGRSTAAIELARNHFGLAAPMQAFRSPGQVVRAVADGNAVVGVIPLTICGDGVEEAEPWWTTLMLESGDAPRVVARLPFIPTPAVKGSAEPLQALVLACRDHDESGDDRTLAVVETGPDLSRDRLRAVLAAGGLETADLPALYRGEGLCRHLVEIRGHVAASDPRVAVLVAPKDPIFRIAVIGGYAAPVPSEAPV